MVSPYSPDDRLGYFARIKSQKSISADVIGTRQRGIISVA